MTLVYNYRYSDNVLSYSFAERLIAVLRRIVGGGGQGDQLVDVLDK